MKKIRETGSAAAARMLVMTAGVAAPLVAISPALGINQVRNQIGWTAMANEGYTGSSVTIAQVEIGHPNPNHVSINHAVRMQLSWPWRPTSDINNLVPGTRNWLSTHATAAASAIVGNGAPGGRIGGIAPQADLITGSIAAGVDLNGNAIEPTETSLAFALFALLDQQVANRSADAMGIRRWKTATVASLPFARRGNDLLFRYGEDPFSRVVNAVVSMTGATIVAPIGDDGLADPMQGQNEIGNILSPGGAHNVIAVGRTDEDGEDIDARTGVGPLASIEWAVQATLLHPDTPADAKPPPPTEPVIYGVRPASHILAPGTNLTLATSLFDDFENPPNTTFGDFWTGTSFATSVVAGGAAMVHDAGNKLGLWVLGRPSQLVTKAVVINSARKVQFNNSAQPDPKTDVLVTTLGLDPENGSGVFSILRLYRQFVLATVKDYRDLQGKTIGPDGLYNVDVIGTDPRVPFVTVFQQPAFTADVPAMPSIQPSGELYHDAGATVRPQQFDDRFGDVPSGGGGGGGGRPGPWDEGYVPPPPSPGVPSGPGGNDPAGNRFKSGWDHGNIGLGFIDLPIGFVPEGSRIIATLCWNRTERWALPDFSSPLGFINPGLVVRDQFLLPPAQQAAQAAKAVTPKFDLGWRSHTIFPSTGAHQHGPKGCQGEVVVTSRSGERLPKQTAEKIVDDLREKTLQGPLVRVGQRSASRGQVRLGLDIQFLLSPAVAADAAFVQGLERAATVWENLINDNVVVTMAVDYTSGFGFIAAASSSQMGEPYSEVRARMIDDSSADELGLLFALPPGRVSFETPAGPLTSDDYGYIVMTTANAKSLGYSVTGGTGNPPPPDSVTSSRGFGSAVDSFIVFNRDFTFDTNPDNGLTPGSIDLVTVMVHELGHALGFISGADAFNDGPTTLDLFRFGNTGSVNDPNTIGEFQSFSREIRTGTEAAFDSVNGLAGIGSAPITPPTANWPFRFSTGVFGGDGRQASHWKDDDLLGIIPYIGVMDPRYDPVAVPPTIVTVADLVAFSVIGWDINYLLPQGANPMNVPVISFQSVGGAGAEDPAIDVVDIGREFEFENIDLELYRNQPGLGNRLIAASRSTESNIEHISIQGANGSPSDILNAQYTLRIQYVGVRVDFGGWVFANFPTTPRAGYRDLPDGQIEYGLAWYVEETRVVGQPITAPDADLSGDGAVNATDLGILLGQWGSTSNPSADLNGDGRVDSADLAILLGKFQPAS